MPEKLNIQGKQFNKLRALRCLGKNRHGQYMWRCECRCGNRSTVMAGDLVSGWTRSCGCSRVVHGMSATRTYYAWRSMRNRCGSSSSRQYRNYGARGLSVCKRWRSFKMFLKDMGEAPRGKSLERVDNSKGYRPSNCCWATQVEQARNMRTNRVLIFQGVRRCASEWSVLFGINLRTLYGRLRRGWPVKRALMEKPKCKYI